MVSVPDMSARRVSARYARTVIDQGEALDEWLPVASISGLSRRQYIYREQVYEVTAAAAHGADLPHRLRCGRLILGAYRWGIGGQLTIPYEGRV